MTIILGRVETPLEKYRRIIQEHQTEFEKMNSFIGENPWEFSQARQDFEDINLKLLEARDQYFASQK